MKSLFTWTLVIMNFIAAIPETCVGHTTELRFNQTPQEIEALCQSEQGILNKKIDTIAKLTGSQINFQSTVVALEVSTTHFSNLLNPVNFLKYVSADSKVRAAADKCEMSVQQLFIDIFAREDLFLAIKSVNGQTEALNTQDQNLLNEYLISFRRNGLELSPEKRKLFIEKKKRLVTIESEFSNNLVNENETLALPLEDLEGLPTSFIESLEKNPEGKYKLTMAYPHYYPFMQNAKRAEPRRQFEFKFNSRGGDTNRKLLEEAIGLRDELAHLLGYKNHASFVLERRMAKTPEQVSSFLVDLVSKLKSKGIENLNEMLEEKKKDIPQATEITSWDWRYYENQLRKNKYQIDNQAIKEYFPIEVVLKGMFEIYQTLLSVKFVEETEAPVWHPGIKKYRIEKKGKILSYFYMDLFPREGKYGHAAAFTLTSGFLRSDGSYERPTSSIVANFNPPTATNPSLLPHSDVETLFHEFGHIMHQTLTRAQYATFSGTNVKTDFVEAPSQMLENWVWRKETLQTLSGHYKDNSKKLPDELIQKMLKAKLLNAGIQNLRQLAFASLDLEYHVQHDANTTQIYKNKMKEIMLIPIQEGTIPQASFGHLMGGYDSGYYGYMWSKVYAQDMFTRFDAEGLLNPETGKDYSEWILQPGGEKEPFDLISGFLRRPPNNEAFLKSLGL